MISSEYIKEQRRGFAMYVLQNRAIPALADGLKSAARRVMWTARNGEKWKSASLAGATMPIHPHAQPEGSINTLTSPYGNNIPLLTGAGAFGTKLKPTSYGACFEGNTLLKMTDGNTKSINRIEIGDNVITHLNQSQKVTDVTSVIKENTIKIEIDNTEYILSDDHTVMIYRDSEYYWAKISEYNDKTDELVILNNQTIK